MKTRFLSVFLILCLALGLLCGCTVTAELPTADIPGTHTTVHFNGDEVSITGAGAMLDGGEVVIAESGTYVLSGTSANSRVIVKADDRAAVTLVLDGLALANPLDEAIYFKTCGAAAVILEAGTENFLLSGEIPGEEDEEVLTITDENEDASGAALRARCAMTLSGDGSLAVGGYINNGIAADGGLTVTGGTYEVYAVNDGVKSDLDVTISGAVFTIQTECDGIQAGGTLDISGGDVTVFTGASAEGADMKVSDSLMMGMGGGPGGGGGGRGKRSSEEASEEAETDETASATDTTVSQEPASATDTETSGEPADTAETENTEEEDRSPSREMPMPGGMDDAMDFWDSDSTDTPSRKGLKATEAIVISGGVITVDAEDDAIHSDGSVTVSGGTLTLSSGDDGVHGETVLDISGGETNVLLCYEGLEARAIYISGGYVNVTATDDGMNAGGGMMGMGPGMRPGASKEAETETEETDDTVSEEAATEEPTVETIVRITGGTVIVNSGGDGLDSNASMYIEGGDIFVSGPSSNWDSPIDYGEGSSEFVISGGFLMAAGYSGMFESPDITEASQGSVYYIQSGSYAPDNAVTTLTDANGKVLAEYAFKNSYNGVLISTPEIAAGETYTLTIDGVDTAIEMTTAQFSNRGGSGEMGGPGGRR